MTRYIPLSLFAERGARELTQPRDRAHSFARAVARPGMRIEVRDWILGDCDAVRIGGAGREKPASPRRPELAGPRAAHNETSRLFADQGSVPLRNTELEE